MDRSNLIAPWMVVQIVWPAAEGWMHTRGYVTGLGYIGKYWAFPVKEMVKGG